MSGEYINYYPDTDPIEEAKYEARRAAWEKERVKMNRLRGIISSNGIQYLDSQSIRWIKSKLDDADLQRLIYSAKDRTTHGHLLQSAEMRRAAKEEETARKKRDEQARKDKEAREKRILEAGPTPDSRLIRSPRDAELAAEEWMRYFGFGDAEVTPVGADEGIDVNSTKAVAQVKAYMVPVGRPDVQNLAGVAAGEKKIGIFFALTGYTPQAIQWADKADIALFSFDLQGEPEAVNSVAHKLMP